ncbi:PP2C family protein-serine/threonine phosphatase [Acidobacterium sp. S8]|uniref:PP2C family protein-serine/threonine phosphatase n=1 Tax=Acidobacterium sp. S8 TaxID=1641854 RepID=UPI0020B15CFB|nr:PP2C family protein-serine/threonine phosphatase [Acidobacterium sp. S8]
MLLIDSQLTASEVLHIFHRDELYLFLGSSFMTVGLIALGFIAIRRRFDALLFWLGIFAILYGGRLWVQSNFLAMMVPPSNFFFRLIVAQDFLVSIPGFFFFQASGYLGRIGRILTPVFTVLMLSLLVANSLGASVLLLRHINNGVLIVALLILIAQSFLRDRKADTKDFVIIRNGLLIFAAFALWNNIVGAFGFYTRVEPYGFAIFLCCLGYVASRRAVERDQQLNALHKELDVAKRIQLSILPPMFPVSPHFKVVARYVPMTSVAGDFYDFLAVQDGKAGLLIADVSGHGVPAALIASMVKLAATSQKEHAAHPAELLAGMNTTLCGNTQNQFVTAAYVYLDAEAGELRYAAAGHPPMLLIRDGEVTTVEENGIMLALFSHAVYTSIACKLRKGDRIVLYTDGIIEAEDTKEEQFGSERLRALLRECTGFSPDQTADLILARVRAWSVEQDDDLTLLVCDYT